MQAWQKINRLPASGIARLQGELLSKLIREELSERHPYYRGLFRKCGIDTGAVKKAEDLQRLPLTSKEQLMPDAEDRFRPRQFVLEAPVAGKGNKVKKGKLFGKKEGPAPGDDRYRFCQLFYTSGRTARPLPLVFSVHDIENLKEAALRSFDLLALTRDDTMINAFSFFPHISFWQIYYGTVGLGATALQTGGGRILGMEKILKALESTEAPVLATFPGYAQFALQTVARFGFKLPNLERVIVGMDYSPMAQVERIQKLMEQVGAKDNRVQRIYFLSEAKSGWAECAPGFGYHTNPDHVLVEIVDPRTGEAKGEGEPGEVVVTNLDATGTVLLRFRTGDLSTGGLTTEPCPNCGRTVPRLLGDLERLSEQYQFKMAGREQLLNGNQLRCLMAARHDILQWYAEISGDQSGDRLELVVKAAPGACEDELKEGLCRQIIERFGIQAEISSGSLRAITERTGIEKNITEKRIFDLRREQI